MNKPQPANKPLIPHPDDFAAWCEHDVTRFVASAWLRAAESQRTAWSEASWKEGKADEGQLRELRTRADAYMAFLECGLTEYTRIVQEVINA